MWGFDRVPVLRPPNPQVPHLLEYVPQEDGHTHGAQAAQEVLEPLTPEEKGWVNEWMDAHVDRDQSPGSYAAVRELFMEFVGMMGELPAKRMLNYELTWFAWPAFLKGLNRAIAKQRILGA